MENPEVQIYKKKTNGTDLMSIEEACSEFKIDLLRLQDLIINHQVKSIKVGDHWHVLRNSIMQYMKNYQI